MENLTSIIITVAVSIWIISIILKTKPVKETFRGVIFILADGLIIVVTSWSIIQEHENSILVILVSLILGFIFGILRGFSVDLWFDHTQNKWLRKGTWKSVAILIFGLIVSPLIIRTLTSDSATVLSISQTLHMGISMLGSRIVWHHRLNKMRIA